MSELTTAVEIDAPPETVWNVLLDFEAYPEWNPFVRSIEGVPVEGERLRVRIEPPDSLGMTVKPRVLEATANERFAWLGRLFVPKLFDGEHSFELEALPDDRTRFTQAESFSGVLVRVALDEESVSTGFEAMNDALRERAEAETRATA